MPETRIQSVNQYLSTIINSTQCDLPAPHWLPILCGSSNQLFRAQWDGRELVLRLNAPAEVAFGACREREAALLAQLAGPGWMPAVVQNQPQQGWLLMQWHGERVIQPLVASDQALLLAAVTQWQLIELSDERLTLDYTALFTAFEPRVAGLPLEAPLQALIQGAHKALASLPPVPQVVTHHDLHPGNLCQREGQLVVLDWEYGALGNPWFDAAALHKHCGISAERLAMLPALVALDQATLNSGLARAVWLLEVLETLWYWVRGLNGTALTMKDLMQQTIRLLKQ